MHGMGTGFGRVKRCEDRLCSWEIMQLPSRQRLCNKHPVSHGNTGRPTRFRSTCTYFLHCSVVYFEFVHTVAATPRKEPDCTLNVPSQEVVLPVPVISANTIAPFDGVAVKVVPDTIMIIIQRELRFSHTRNQPHACMHTVNFDTKRPANERTAQRKPLSEIGRAEHETQCNAIVDYEP